jgi:hypothetical protein
MFDLIKLKKNSEKFRKTKWEKELFISESLKLRP